MNNFNRNGTDGTFILFPPPLRTVLVKPILFLLSSIILLSDSSAQENVYEHIVLFDLDSYELKADEERSLKKWLGDFSSDTIRKLEVIGHADHLAGTDHNLTLSEKRANTVLRCIEKSGLIRYNISLVSAKGERFSKATPGQNGRAADRKVEVRLFLNGTENEISDVEKLEKAEVGESIVLKNLNFIGGRHFLLAQARPELFELTKIMQDNPTLKIEVQGHICCKYDSVDGLDIDTRIYDLSLARARFITEQLVEAGIDEFRMKFKGFGSTRPLVYPEMTEADRTANRRVEIRILKK